MNATPQFRPLVFVLHVVNASVLVGLAVRCYTSWDRLPAMVPMHFDFDGVPNRWAEKGPEFGILFFIPWFVTLLLYGMRAGMGYFARRPELANLPSQLRGLPPEKVAPLFDAVRDLLLAAATAANLAVGAAVYGSLEVALGKCQRMPFWTFKPWLVVLAVVVIGGSIRLLWVSSRIKRELGA
jgi:hypothetical protein